MNFYKTLQVMLLMFLISLSHTFFAEINRDLELDALYSTINYTQTAHGSQALQQLLANPTDNLQTLNGRQSIIAHIVENESLHTKIDALLEKFSTHEPFFERILQKASGIETAALEEFYFSHPYFKEWNYSPARLELGQIAYLGNLCSSLIQHSLVYAIFTLGLGEEHACSDPLHHHHHKDGSKKNKKKPTLLQSLKTFAKSQNVRYAFHVWHIIAQVQELYSIQAIVRNHCNCITEIQKQLIGIADGMRTLNSLYTTLREHPEITAHLTYYKELENICLSTNISHKLQTLLTLLATDTFKGKASPFSRIGIILAAYKLIQEIGQELQPALNAVGEIDAYASCAQLFKEHKNSQLPYSFAHYTTDSTHPQLAAHNFWHPLATTDYIQLNSIALGANDKPQHIILTGPNACGKSTTLKALTLCAYLAQTITIVPAQEYSQTVYKEIYSSMVVTDDLAKNKSLFVCEITDAEKLLEKIETLKDGQYMLITLDELFKSTHHGKGQKIACRLLEILYACPQVITLVSTHFEELTILADKQKNVSANYTIDNFLLKPGIGSFDNSLNIVNKQVRSRLTT